MKKSILKWKYLCVSQKMMIYEPYTRLFVINWAKLTVSRIYFWSQSLLMEFLAFDPPFLKVTSPLLPPPWPPRASKTMPEKMNVRPFCMSGENFRAKSRIIWHWKSHTGWALQILKIKEHDRIEKRYFNDQTTWQKLPKDSRFSRARGYLFKFSSIMQSFSPVFGSSVAQNSPSKPNTL